MGPMRTMNTLTVSLLPHLTCLHLSPVLNFSWKLLTICVTSEHSCKKHSVAEFSVGLALQDAARYHSFLCCIFLHSLSTFLLTLFLIFAAAHCSDLAFPKPGELEEIGQVDGMTRYRLHCDREEEDYIRTPLNSAGELYCDKRTFSWVGGEHRCRGNIDDKVPAGNVCVCVLSWIKPFCYRPNSTAIPSANSFD